MKKKIFLSCCFLLASIPAISISLVSCSKQSKDEANQFISIKSKKNYISGLSNYNASSFWNNPNYIKQLLIDNRDKYFTINNIQFDLYNNLYVSNIQNIENDSNFGKIVFDIEIKNYNSNNDTLFSTFTILGFKINFDIITNNTFLNNYMSELTNVNIINDMVRNSENLINILSNDIIEILDPTKTTIMLTDKNYNNVEDGNLHANVHFVFKNGQVFDNNYCTNIKIVKFNRLSIIIACKTNINNINQLLNLNQILIDCQANKDFSPFYKIDSNSLKSTIAINLNTTSKNDVAFNKYCYNINLSAILSDVGYCFFEGNVATITYDFGDFVTHILPDGF